MAGNKRLLVGPAVEDRRTLESLVVRLAHYLAHVGADRIEIAATPGLLAAQRTRSVVASAPPPGIDPDTLRRVPAIESKIALRVVPAEATEPTSDLLLLWDVRGREREPWRSLVRRFRQNVTVFDGDWSNTRTDGIWLAELGLVMSKSNRAFDKQESERFRRRTEHLLGRTTAYLIATGPSATAALEVDMSDGVRIMCNTAILDDALIDHVAPDIVTFADPIFHFGPSTYAHRFQRALGRAAARQDFTIVTLERFAHLLRDRLPHLADRIVGVRLGGPSWPQNYDLLRDLVVRPYPNIMTMLMLPLAATFCRSVELFGFDGREPRESYFWRHGSTVQFDDELRQIRLAHPGFFQLDYGDYYAEHLTTVERLLMDIEVRGGSVVPRTRSNMLPLRRRGGERPVARPRGARAGTSMVSITPDWTGDFAHFGPWERAVGPAARAHGYEYWSLASRALVSRDGSAIPTFTHGTLGRDCSNPRLFEDELTAGLDATAGDGAAIVCFYAADVWHLAGVLQVAVQRPSTTFAVNLMRGHGLVAELEQDTPTVPARLLRECLYIASGTSVHVCLDTEAIASDLSTATGIRLPTWPMIMLSDPLLLERYGRSAPVGNCVRLVAPVHHHTVKGFPEVVALAERLSDALLLRKLSFTARFVHQQGDSTFHTTLAQRFLDSGGDLVTENLTDAQYAALVGNAHVVLIPHRLATFRTRTSGALLDAVAAGKPVIAVDGTWAGEVVDRFGIGTTYTDSDVDSLEAAVRKVVGDLDAFTERATEQRARVIAAFRPQQLVRFLESLASAHAPPPDRGRLAGLRSLVDSSVDAQWVAPAPRDRRIVELVERDDLRRSRDDALDKVEDLRKALVWYKREVNRLRGNPPTVGTTPAAEAAAPPVTRSESLTTTLEENEYDRSAGAHLDELALVAALVDPESDSARVMVDVGAHRGSAFRRFHEAGWMIFVFEPDPASRRLPNPEASR